MNTYEPSVRSSARLVPAERLNAITSLIGEGAVFEGAFHSNEDLGIKVDGQLLGGIARKSLEISGSATVLGDVLYDALIDIHPRARLRGKIDYRGDVDAML